jgi:glucose-6-phosphate 1-dehydrogenase
MNTTSIVIFGASGDLSQRKLIPGLFNLYRKGRLPASFRILGFSSSQMTDEEFLKKVGHNTEKLKEGVFDYNKWRCFTRFLHYQPGTFTSLDDFHLLAERLIHLEDGPANRLFYLATPPRFFPEVVGALGKLGLTEETGGWRRVVIEKPFGTDAETADELNRQLHQVWDENQIYRIDHYLGKETVQNILTFRFANSIYEPLWNHNFIDHIQITVSEKIDVGRRAEFYDSVGALRDMFQNHIFQLLSLITMEAPFSYHAHDLRGEKIKVLRSIRPLTRKVIEPNAVRGQYNGYRDLPGVPPDSQTETFAALRVFIDNPRWQGVPFYLRSGKSLAKKSTEIIIQFKRMPIVPGLSGGIGSLEPNVLSFCLQPDEGFHQRFEVKVPDTTSDMCTVEMAFHYREAFGESAIPEAYERLLLDALNGDPSLFTRGDREELAWELLDPLLKAWKDPTGPPLYGYNPGTWGPVAADQLLERDGRNWLRVCGMHPEAVISSNPKKDLPDPLKILVKATLHNKS